MLSENSSFELLRANQHWIFPSLDRVFWIRPTWRSWVVWFQKAVRSVDMSGVQDQLEIKFRLTDGSDIGPKSFPAVTSVATLKESILTQWPKEKINSPRTVKDIKLISAGKILENSRTLGECRSPLCDIPGGVTTMHVVVQPSSTEKEHHSQRIDTGIDIKAGESPIRGSNFDAHPITAHDTTTQVIRLLLCASV
ncbi:hypothetical protein HHK36_007321 [Tetracentron sinense]|uniref:UBL3-like ubiquitin domain-containing protein n=1 Tax=Tetracentron sinense TaxID=13715 RepID=A0A834ZIQ9_TETSI|nr:hypothetical protein HHK36_007321 [Tetracentron sinense]